MKYLSVCSGIEAASVAWHPLGWEPVAFSEIEKFPCAVLAHHYPHVPNLGDMTKFKEWPDADVDVLVGGTPCQSFSIAGLRKGLDDPRGNLMLTYAAIARRYRPDWLGWENVPGVLSSDGGCDFGSLLGLLSGRHIEVPPTGWNNSGIVPGIKGAYGLAWRVLDAQYFGVAQRRRRVFVVGYLGDWQRAAAVLLERASLCGNPAPRREKGEGSTYDVAPCIAASGCGFERTGDTRGQDCLIPEITGTLGARANSGGGFSSDFECAGGVIPETTAVRMVAFGEYKDDGTASSLKQRDHKDATDLVVQTQYSEELAGSLTARHDSSPCADRGQNVLAIRTANTSANGHGVSDGVAHTLDQANGQCVAFSCKDDGRDVQDDLAPTMRSMNSVNSNQNAGGQIAVAFQSKASATNSMNPTEIAPTMDKGKSDGIAVAFEPGVMSRDGGYVYMQVRRLTPRECERLQGFPDDYTSIPTWNGWRKMDAGETPESCMADGLEIRQSKKSKKWMVKDADGPRYKALGNSMAVPVMRWIGERIEAVESIMSEVSA